MKLTTTITGSTLSGPGTSDDKARTVSLGSEAPTADQGPNSQPFCFGRYRVLRVLGQGSFGDVFLAQDDELKRLVAVKVQRPERVRSSFDAAEFLREARLVAQLDHPGIVAVYDVGRTQDGRCYIVSKYIEGMTVLAMLREHRPSFEESAHIVIAVAEALQYAHEMGVVHRDLKPSNILISSTWEVFLTDFGIALSETDLDLKASIIGTPPYMSPEQARGDSQLVDGRSDTFSLGTLFYELLAGELPFAEAGDKTQVLNRILNDKPTPLRELDSRIPAQFERICLKALAKSPDARYASTQEMGDELRHALSCRRRRWPRAVAALVGLAIVILVVGWAIPATLGKLRAATEMQVAKLVLDAGGGLRIASNRERLIRNPNQLPAKFQINAIDFGGNNHLRDDDLRMLRGISNLNALDLNTTLITDRGLKYIEDFTGLTELWLNYTSITSDGFQCLKDLTALEHLDLNYTSVDDESLKVIGKLSDLKFLGLSYTHVTDGGMVRLKGLNSLMVLRLEGTGITNAALMHLKGFTSLKQLDVGHTAIDDKSLDVIGNLTRLRFLSLANTDVTDRGLARLQRLNSLEVLKLDGTGITDTCLDHLKSLKNLQRLSLEETSLSDDALVRFRRELPHCEINR